MEDLVTRLRSTDYGLPDDGPILTEAANEIERLNLELQKRDKCSYMGPMRDCPTHGDRDAKRLRWLLEYWWFGNNSGVDFGSALTEDEVRATIDAAMLKTQNVELTGSEPKAERPC